MMRHRFQGIGGWLPAAFAVAVVVMLATPVAAQVNSATIEVYTVDQQGLPLPGVTVQARNTDTGAGRSDVSDTNGQAAFRALPPGDYAISANLEGFAPITDQAVVVRVGQTARLTLTLQVQASETIVVTAEVPVVDVLKTDSSTNIVPEQIQSLPVPDREFEKLAFITPTAERERGSYRFIQNSPVIGAGGNASQTSILVDGAEFTDPAAGLSRARFSQDAIQEFRVIASRFDTEIGGSQGGAMSIVTKSGTNELHGSVFGFYRDASLRETGALEEENNDYNREQYGFTIGGPIVRDKTHYFLSYERVDITDIAPFRPGGAFTDLATNYPFPTTQDLALLSLDHQFSANARGFLKGVYERFRQENFRVGGVSDESNGQQLNRDNWNVVLGLTNVIGDGSKVNEARFQIGDRDYDEPPNASDVEEWFSGGVTLKTGTNTLGYLIGYGSYWELRDTFHLQTGHGRSTHDWKLGGAWFHVEEESDIPTFQGGLFVYADDTRNFPLTYLYGEGSADVTVKTEIYSAFVQDDWRMAPNFTLSLGLRYDYDTDGNNPDFTHPLVGQRAVDENNFQPRVGFSWDLGNNGRSVLRGGVGLFTGRYLLVPNFAEEQQNGVTGRIQHTNANGLYLCLVLQIPLDQCPLPPLNPADPENSGVPLGTSITLLEDSLKAPQTTQYSVGFTQRLGDTGLYLDLEGLYAEGYNEIFVRDTNWNGNADPGRPNSDYDQINKYTNDGHSEYKAVIASLNGTFGAGHLLTASFTWMDKKNLSDDFSPVFPTGYPSDPADPEGEWGYSRGHEDYRAVVSGVFRLPLRFYLGATWQYGSGQPWNRILGYDYNTDGKNSDRAPGVARNGEEGPTYNSFNLRLGWMVPLGGSAELELIAEAFNVFNTVNYDVTSINNAEYLAGPTITNPTIAYVPNTAFGTYRATLPPREIQLGARFRF